MAAKNKSPNYSSIPGTPNGKPFRYRVEVHQPNGKVKKWYATKPSTLRERVDKLLRTLPSCDYLVASRCMDNYTFLMRRGMISYC